YADVWLNSLYFLLVSFFIFLLLAFYNTLLSFIIFSGTVCEKRERERVAHFWVEGMASKLLLVVVFVLDLIAFALAVAAEQRRTKGKQTTDETRNYCVYDSDIATGLGVGSFLFLMASQVLIVVASRCLCCGKALRPSAPRAWAICLFITCWVTFVIAEACLLAGSVRNAYHTKYTTKLTDNPPSCEMLRRGIFGAGAAFVVLTGVFSELYYVSYSKANDDHMSSYARDTGVRMGNL
ncbi:hypothetical protein F2P56_009761, partial [Juglans regia]